MILITGGLGYIGSFTSKFLSKKTKPISIDNHSRGNIFSKKYCSNYKINIKNISKVKRVIKNNKIDLILHLAAYTCVRESKKKPELYKNNNFINQKIFLDTIIKYGIKKIIFASSYSAEGFTKNKSNNFSPYAKYKFFLEEYLKKKSIKNKLKVIIIRYPNVAGASRDGSLGEKNDKISRIFPTFYKNFKKKRAIKIFYNNKIKKYPQRSYFHIEDIAKLNLKIIKYIYKMKNNYLLVRLSNKDKYSNKYIFNLMSKKLNTNNKFIIKNIDKTEKLYSPNSNSLKFLKKIKWKPTSSSINKIITTNLRWFKKIYE